MPPFSRGSVTARRGSSSSRTPRPRPRPRPLLLQFGPASAAFLGLLPPCTRGGWSGALNKVEHYGVQRVTGDGRCMFRALVKGMAKNKGIPLTSREEVQDADDLRMAVKEVICDDETERQKYEEAVIAITVDESLRRYCHRIRRSDFWGGESELLVLSKLCRQPIIIYIPEREYHGRGNGFIPIAEYGLEFSKDSKQWKKKVPVRLLYSGRNHYDLLV
uniref:Ubiquitin thioesterase OTU n=1 Tax=Oryza sativa subsp. japonica TaxID=39947 RepID=Q10NL2_ORYSJ|nr:OTU-like cysteine protease family protein, expressed [Oryza sativa Japonica Group]